MFGYRRIHSPGGKSILVQAVENVTLRVSDAVFAGLDLPVVPRHQSGVIPVHGVLGSDLLMQRRMTLDRGRLQVQKER